ncbi:MAG: tyrosine-protein phosphatase [Acidobacteriota bacterium]|nr:MAG: tyrosine-protein phosphatase [Acidobacteriota bacterium]
MIERTRPDLSTTYGSLARTALLISTILTLAFAGTTFAQSSREKIDGVQNFGRVTENFFRGGEVTPAGVDALAGMGVRTIIDLRDEESPGEAEAAQRNGIKYLKFPMSGHATPDENTVEEILSIIQRAKEPIYVHCSAGKHRAGTIAALYRIRAQGWDREKAWAEQKSYGFGPPEGHPMLYAYVYGGKSETAVTSSARPSDLAKTDKSSKKMKKDDDDDDDDDSSKSGKKKEGKSDNKDDDDDDDDRDRKVNRGSRIDRAVELSESAEKAEKKEEAETSKSNSPGLSSSAGYISIADVIKRAKAGGASGDLLKIDLEWDPARSVATWDVTFSSGDEYEFDAGSGNHLGTKSKAPAKLATLSPLNPDDTVNGWLTFQEVIRKAEAGRSQKVMEMELKQIKGRPEILYEVVLADGTTIYYDATTGKVIDI